LYVIKDVTRRLYIKMSNPFKQKKLKLIARVEI